VLDEAGARARIGTMTRPPEIKELEAEIEESAPRRRAAIKQAAFRGRRRPPRRREAAKKKLERNPRRLAQPPSEETIVTVDDEDIMQVVSKWTGVPLRRMEKKETEKLLNMEDELKNGHRPGRGVIAISKALRRSRADLKDPRRPIGSFLFLGPTGVGKTYLAKHPRRVHVRRCRRLIQIDMSEYMEKFTVSAA
jgi:ATP-dependent Clp protease ATP-binding subunit ClpC